MITVFVAQNGPADGKHGIKADGSEAWVGFEMLPEL